MNEMYCEGEEMAAMAGKEYINKEKTWTCAFQRWSLFEDTTPLVAKGLSLRPFHDEKLEIYCREQGASKVKLTDNK